MFWSRCSAPLLPPFAGGVKPPASRRAMRAFRSDRARSAASARRSAARWRPTASLMRFCGSLRRSRRSGWRCSSSPSASLSEPSSSPVSSPSCAAALAAFAGLSSCASRSAAVRGLSEPWAALSSAVWAAAMALAEVEPVICPSSVEKPLNSAICSSSVGCLLTASDMVCSCYWPENTRTASSCARTRRSAI